MLLVSGGDIPFLIDLADFGIFDQADELTRAECSASASCAPTHTIHVLLVYGYVEVWSPQLRGDVIEYVVFLSESGFLAGFPWTL